MAATAAPQTQVSTSGARSRLAQDLAHKLAPYPLGRYAWQLEASGFKYKVNPYMIAAIAGLESTYGQAACGANYWGWNSCSSWPWQTVSQGINVVTRKIRFDYLNNWGYRDVWSVGNKWCSCGSHYGYELQNEIQSLGGPVRPTYYGAVSAVA